MWRRIHNLYLPDRYCPVCADLVPSLSISSFFFSVITDAESLLPNGPLHAVTGSPSLLTFEDALTVAPRISIGI